MNYAYLYYKLLYGDCRETVWNANRFRNRLLYLGMPEKIRKLIIFNEIDVETAKQIAKNAYPK